MTRIATLLGISIALALTIASGIQHGRSSHRWGVSAEMFAAGRTLEDHFPDTIGPWRVVRKDRLSDESNRILQPAGQVVRVYENPNTHSTVAMFLLLGPMGPTAEHTPELCMSSRTYREIGGRKAVNLADESTQANHSFWTATFEQTNVEGGCLRVWWAWTRGAVWEASADARRTYFGAPYLYKIHVQTVVNSEAPADTSDPCRSFLESFLPLASQFLELPSS